MHHAASQRDPLAAFFATPWVVDFPFPCILFYPRHTCDLSFRSWKLCLPSRCSRISFRAGHICCDVQSRTRYSPHAGSSCFRSLPPSLEPIFSSMVCRSQPWQTVSTPAACPRTQLHRGQAFFLKKDVRIVWISHINNARVRDRDEGNNWVMSQSQRNLDSSRGMRGRAGY